MDPVTGFGGVIPFKALHARPKPQSKFYLNLYIKYNNLQKTKELLVTTRAVMFTPAWNIILPVLITMSHLNSFMQYQKSLWEYGINVYVNLLAANLVECNDMRCI